MCVYTNRHRLATCELPSSQFLKRILRLHYHYVFGVYFELQEPGNSEIHGRNDIMCRVVLLQLGLDLEKVVELDRCQCWCLRDYSMKLFYVKKNVHVVFKYLSRSLLQKGLGRVEKRLPPVTCTLCTYSLADPRNISCTETVFINF